MDNDKEQKLGLLKRLFGAQATEDSGAGDNQSVKQVSYQDFAYFNKQVDENEILPWEKPKDTQPISHGIEKGEVDRAKAASFEPVEKPKSSQSTFSPPTWEELLNKIAPVQEAGSDSKENAAVKWHTEDKGLENSKPEAAPKRVELDKAATNSKGFPLRLVETVPDKGLNTALNAAGNTVRDTGKSAVTDMKSAVTETGMNPFTDVKSTVTNKVLDTPLSITPFESEGLDKHNLELLNLTAERESAATQWTGSHLSEVQRQLEEEKPSVISSLVKRVGDAIAANPSNPQEYVKTAVQNPGAGIPESQNSNNQHSLSGMTARTPQEPTVRFGEKLTARREQEMEIGENGFSVTNGAEIIGKEKPAIQNDKTRWLLEQVKECTSKGELDKAGNFLEIAIMLEDHPDVMLEMAKHQLNLNDREKSLKHCLDSLEAYADSPEAVELLSLLINHGLTLDAKRIAALKPGKPENCVALAQLCLNHNYLAEALELFARAQRIGLNPDEIQRELGTLYEQMGNPAQAVKHYRRDLELNGELNTACKLFDLYFEMEDYERAGELADSRLRGEQDPLIKNRLAKVDVVQGIKMFESNRFEQALESFYSAAELGHEEANGWVLRTLLEIADTSLATIPLKAQSYYEQVLEVGGFDPGVAKKLAKSYMDSELYEKALKPLQELYAKNPLDSSNVMELVVCYQKLEKMDKAAELLEALAESGNLERNMREQLLNYYRSQGRFEDAKRHMDKVFEPGSEAYKAGLQSLVWEQVRFMVENGDFEQAWQICCQELRNDPSSNMKGMGMKVLSERVEQLITGNLVEQALKELETGRKLGLNVLDLGLREASLYESVGNDRAALRVYEEMAQKAPEVWEKIKELYLKAATKEYLAGNLSEARSLLEDAHSKQPKNEEIRRALVVLYQETGQYALALALSKDTLEENEIQITTDHLNVLRPKGYRRIRLG